MRISRVTGPRRSEIVELPDPVPGVAQVLVDVLASGVCTSDISPWLGQGTPEEPVSLGHEIVGRVIGAGKHAGRWRVGDVVTGLGDRGFATRAVMDANAILPVPAGIAPEHAIGEPIADLYEALSRTSARAGSRIAVVGLGFMGLGLVQLAKVLAPAALIGVDPRPAARERALALGASAAYHPDELPAELTQAPTTGPEGRIDVVLEAAGATSALGVASSLVRPFGEVCVVGYHHTGDAMMDMDLWYKAATVINGFCPDRTRLVEAMSGAIDLIASRRFSYEPLITHRFGLDGVDSAYELMTARDASYVKGVVIP